MVWSIIFYFCQLFAFFFSVLFPFIFVIYLPLVLIAGLFAFISILLNQTLFINLFFYNFKNIFSLLLLLLLLIQVWFSSVCFALEKNYLIFPIDTTFFFFIGHTLQPPLACWSLCYGSIWHHLIMVPRG